MNLPELTEAERIELLIVHCCTNIRETFLELGGLLADYQDRALWSEHHESFKDFIEMLGIGSYSWVTRLIDISRIVSQQLLTKEEVLQIGVAKACLLLPAVKKGTLSEDIKLLARDCTFTDLRIALGHNVPDEDSEEYIICTRCGADVTVRKGMIRKR